MSPRLARLARDRGPRRGRLCSAAPVAAELLEDRVLMTYEGLHDFEIAGRASNGEWYGGGYDAQPLGTETGFQNERFARWSPSINWQTVRHADFDGDGLSDVAGRDPVSGNWYVTLSDAVGSTTRFAANWAPGTTWSDVAAVDLADFGDRETSHAVTFAEFTRKADLIGRAGDGYWWGVVSNADGTFRNVPLGRWAPAAGWRDVRFLDINSDGATDVIGRTSAGEWWALKSRVAPDTFEGLAYDNVFLTTWNEASGWRDVLVANGFLGKNNVSVLARSSGGEWRALDFNAAGTATTVIVGNWVEAAGWRDVMVGRLNSIGTTTRLIGRTAAGEWWSSRSELGGLVSVRVGQWAEAAGWRDVQLANNRETLRDWVVGRTAAGEWYGMHFTTSTSSPGTNVFLGRWNEAAAWRDVRFAPVTRSLVAFERQTLGTIQYLRLDIYGNRAGTAVTVEDRIAPVTMQPGVRITYLVAGSAVPRESSYFQTMPFGVDTYDWAIRFFGHRLADSFTNDSSQMSIAVGYDGDDSFDGAFNGAVDWFYGGAGLNTLLTTPGEGDLANS